MADNPSFHRESSGNRPSDLGIQGRSFFDDLSPPPRTVSKKIRLRMMMSQFNNHELPGFCFGAMAVLLGMGFILSSNGVVLGWMLLCLGVCIIISIAYVLLSGTWRVVRVLIWGKPAAGIIDQLFAAGIGKYQTYSHVLGEMTKHQKALISTRIWRVLLKSPFKNWRVKFLVEDSHGQSQQIDGRMNLEPRAINEHTDPQVLLLVDRRRGPMTCVALEQFPWLGVSHSGELMVHVDHRPAQEGVSRALARALQVVVPTYCLSALGLAVGFKPLFSLPHDPSISALLGACIVALLTFTHGVVPIFAYRFFVDGLNLFASKADRTGDKRLQSKPFLRLMSGFGYLHMSVWYGGPIILFAVLCGWISLAWAFVHVLLAGHGRRWWVFLQHGSTSMALVLFVLCFSGDHLFPVGVLVVLFQSLLLTIVEWKGKRLWVKGEPDTAQQ